MGKQKQHRRSAKKKGGRGGVAGQNDVPGGESVKCTACAQVVKPEDTIACLIPECDRIFCTKKCAKSCIVKCADAICPRPNRCHPCASGKTLEQLERRNQRRKGAETELRSMHTPYTKCDYCDNQVCGQCKYFDVCSQCNKHICFECIDSEGCIINFCVGACTNFFCKGCDKGFDTFTKRCTNCTVEDQFSLCGDETLHHHIAGEKLSSDEKWKEIAEEVVLEFAEASKKALVTIALLSHFVKIETATNTGLALADRSLVEAGRIDKYEEGTNKRETTSLTARIVRRTGRSNESITERVASVYGLYMTKYAHFLEEVERKTRCFGTCLQECRSNEQWKKLGLLNRQLYLFSMQRMDLSRGVLSALLPDISALLESFHMMEGLVSEDNAIVNLQTIHLDLMQDFYSRELCGYCLRPAPSGDETKRCGGCSAIRYCDAKCQALSWPVHRHHCERMKIARRDYNERVLDEKKFEAGLEKAFCGWPGEEYLDQSKV